MSVKKYKFTRTTNHLEFIVPSKEITLGKFALIFQGGLYLIMIILSVIIIITDSKIGSLVAGTLMVLISLYLSKNCYETYHWLSKGKEVLSIDLPKKEFIYKKIAHKEFEIIKADLNQFEGFSWCPENDEALDDPSRYGIYGGRICFWINDKKYRMGIDLTKEEARSCLTELNDFLSKTSV